MKLLFLDDSTQKTCRREKMQSMVAVGGLMIDHTQARKLETEIDQICKLYGFPDREPFKWSSKNGSWLRENLRDENRSNFYRDVLVMAKEHSGIGMVCAVDPSMKAANPGRNAQEDSLLLALERFDWILTPQKESGMVIVARPSGGRPDEDKFLDGCVALVSQGTCYTKFTGLLATQILTTPYQNSRLLQIADLIVSITNAMIAGNTKYAGVTFPFVKDILHRDGDRINGVGVKIHPDFSYMNLYHWILGDKYIRRGKSGWSLPFENYPYANDEMMY